MKIFVTGATGGSGTALIPKLIAAGHSVTGLARTESSATTLAGLGATSIKGDISDLSTCASAAGSADAVVHLAFDHQAAFSGDFAGACEKDRAVIKAMCDALVQAPGAEKTFIFCSGTLGLQGTLETDQSERNEHMPRYKSTDLAFSYADKGLRVIQIRLAPITYRAGDKHGEYDQPHDFTNMQIAQGKKDGFVGYIDGTAWPTCTYDDSADVFVKALDPGQRKLPNPATLHAVADQGVPIKLVAEKLGEKIGVPAKQVDAKDAMQLGFVGMLMSQAHEANSEWTKEVLGWKPTGRGLLDQIDRYSFA